jgi:hypothetical protein
MRERWQGALVCALAVWVFSNAFMWGRHSAHGGVAEMCDTFRSFVINDARYTCERVVP